MEITFIKYLNQVRLMHVFQDICTTLRGVLKLAENHGFASYKTFIKSFREIYGCTPREVRRYNS
jgi:transcriptional regulator GlxA family with amidase domain